MLERTDAATSAGRLVADVSRCRRRLRMLAFVRHVSLTASAALAVAGGFVVVLRPDVAHAAVWLAGAVATACAAGALLAARDAPGLRSTAAALDKQLGLEDRVVAALQFSTHGDPVAGLVVRDASSRIAGVAPAQVFPVDVQTRRRALLLPGVAAVLVLVTAVVWDRDWVRRAVGSSGVQGGASARSTRLPRAGETRGKSSQPSATSPPQGGSPERMPGAPVPQQAADNTRPSGGQAPDNPSAGSPSSTSTRNDETRAATAAPVGAIREPPLQTSSSGGSAGGSAGRGSAMGEAASNARTGAGSGAISPGLEKGAGGIRGSVESRGLTRDQERRPAADASYAARYRAAWIRAQASLAQNQVPRAYRSYIRDYFAAIRPLERE